MAKHICIKEPQLAEMHADIKYIRENLERISVDNAKNTEFRQKAYGVVGVLTLIGGTVTGFVIFILEKVWK